MLTLLQRVEDGVAVGHVTVGYMMEMSQISMMSQQGHMTHQQLTQVQ